MDNSEVVAKASTVIRHPVVEDLLKDIKSRQHVKIAKIVFVDAQGMEIKDYSAYFLV